MSNSARDVIIEFAQVGAYVKVSAFHEASMTEVSIVGDPRETEAVLKATVLKKLFFVMGKSEKKAREGTTKAKKDRGIVV
ncbi:hypothetical protein O4H49_05120 [Kiloniella laminariae]|uniref:DUF6898 domain-containing protein n=1 Tax=Kiloniella laminariae TaxID=454162 RepID=A0ABT4LGA8_9PROT|nr:hypothetical protein [Kiloniella laminariae]MCZ4280144.1 hypothetical protein [Kiloniella laminariae]